MTKRSDRLFCALVVLLLAWDSHPQTTESFPPLDVLPDTPTPDYIPTPDNTLPPGPTLPPVSQSSSPSRSPHAPHRSRSASYSASPAASQEEPSSAPDETLAESFESAAGPSSVESTAVTPQVLYGPPPPHGTGSGGATCNNCDAPVYDYCVNNLQTACDANKNYDCPACFLWGVTQRCDGKADPNCTPSLKDEFPKLSITAGQFSVDDVKGTVTEFLVMPGTNVVPTPVRGTEDYSKVGETIWSYAWDVAMLGHAPATKFDEHTAGLAIVGPSKRAQHQMHIHIAKINPAVRKALVTSAWGKTPFSSFITIPNPVGPGHPMRVKFVKSGVTEPLGPTAYPFASILDPSPPQGYKSLAKLYCISFNAHAQLDGHTASTEWPQYGIMVCRQSSGDNENGYFIVGTYDYPGVNLLCTNGLKC